MLDYQTVALSVNNSPCTMSHLSTLSRVKFLLPSCLECRRLLRDIGDSVDANSTYDLLLGLYQHHWARSHEREDEIPLYRSNFYWCGEPGIRKRWSYSDWGRHVVIVSRWKAVKYWDWGRSVWRLWVFLWPLWTLAKQWTPVVCIWYVFWNISTLCE